MNEDDAGSSYRGVPQRTPLFEAQHSERYARQQLIKAYQDRFDCRLVVLNDQLMPYSIPLFEELLNDADPTQHLHVMLRTLGGDGETALQLAHQAQTRCRELTIIVPDKAKSAGTLLTLGAHHILMGPTSDLGPIDPQFQGSDGRLVAAKTIIAAADHAFSEIESKPETLPLHAALLADTTAIDIQEARSALDHAEVQLVEALSCNPDRDGEEIDSIRDLLSEALIGEPNDHSATISADHAIALKLPVVKLDPQGDQWRMIWRLWIRYFNMGQVSVYEGERASQIFNAASAI